MTDDPALRIGTTKSGARIFAFLVDAGLVAGTLTVADTFWSTVRRSSDVVWET